MRVHVYPPFNIKRLSLIHSHPSPQRNHHPRHAALPNSTDAKVYRRSFQLSASRNEKDLVSMLPIIPTILRPSRVCYFTNGLLPTLRSSNQINDERKNWRFTIHTFQLPTPPLSLCDPFASEQIDHCSPFPSFFSLAIGNGRRNTLM